MSDPVGDPMEEHIVNYVPDEVCVLIEADAPEDSNTEVAELYEHVRARLNAQIVQLIRASQPTEPYEAPPFEQDLAPDLLRERFANTRSVLQPLSRPTERGRDAARLPPFVSLSPARAGRTIDQFFFQIGRERARLDQRDLERLRIGRESVRELVLLLNRFTLNRAQEPLRGQRWVIRAVTPNWLTLALQMGCGCPAGLPIPAGPDEPWHFKFSTTLQEALEQPERGKVIVAVLDTCPTQQALDTAAQQHAANTLLREVQRTVRMNEPALVPTASLSQHLAGCLPRWQQDMLNGPVHTAPHQFAMPDHGLFVTGVVVDIVRRGTAVHLIRVLNDFGVGDLLAITHALAALPSRLLGEGRRRRRREPRLIVNLSLGIDLPIPVRLLERWFPRTARDPVALKEHQPDIDRALRSLEASLQAAIDWLFERGVLVVAASGNDALRPDVTPNDPPPPRFPARYENVLGVAAMRRNEHLAADYSNRGDLTTGAWPGHVATFGGNVIRPSNAQSSALTERDDSIVGIFSSRSLPGSGDANTSGWVRWAGTSFSAPIATAVAARLWAIDPELAPLEVMAAVRGFARDPHGGPDPESPLEVPVLEASQG